jgi:hypothetical protein
MIVASGTKLNNDTNILSKSAKDYHLQQMSKQLH